MTHVHTHFLFSTLDSPGSPSGPVATGRAVVLREDLRPPVPPGAERSGFRTGARPPSEGGEVFASGTWRGLEGGTYVGAIQRSMSL